MPKSIYPRSRIVLRSILVRVPRLRRALISIAERVLNAGPDALFIRTRRAYSRRLDEGRTDDPPRLLRFAANRRRIPKSVDAFQLLGSTDLGMARRESLTVQQLYWAGPRWNTRYGAGIDLWAQLCSRAQHVVEIGANVGLYAIAGGSAAGADYTAYEPHPRSCDALRTNLELNGLTGVRVIQAATVPDRGVDTIDLLCPTGTDRATPTGAMVRGSAFESYDTVRQHETIAVPALPISEAIAGHDLVKIDVEGLEAKLLASCWEQLVIDRPVVMVEIHDNNVDLRRIVPRLEDELDASVYAMCHDHLVGVPRPLLEKGPLTASYHSYDFLIVPADRAAMAIGL